MCDLLSQIEHDIKCDIEYIIKTVTKNEKLVKYETGPIKKLENIEIYSSQIFTVSLRDLNSERIVNLTMKFASRIQDIRESRPISLMYENEMFFYLFITEEFQKFRDSIGCIGKYILASPILLCSSKEGKEFIVTQNFEPDGFRVLDEKLDFTHEHIKLIFQYYGYLHAYGYGMKTLDGQTFWNLQQKLKNVTKVLFSSPKFFNDLRSLCFAINTFLKPEEDRKILFFFEKYLTNLDDIIDQVVDDSGFAGVFTHGDSCRANILFKYDEETGKPVELRFIDWQLMKIGNPICDLSYALYSGTQDKTILDNLDEYLRAYYDSLAETLQSFGRDASRIMPYNLLLNQWVRYSRFGFLMALKHIILKSYKIKFSEYDRGESSETSDSSENPQSSEDVILTTCDNTYFVTQEFQKRIRVLLKHMIEIEAL